MSSEVWLRWSLVSEAEILAAGGPKGTVQPSISFSLRMRKKWKKAAVPAEGWVGWVGGEWLVFEWIRGGPAATLREKRERHHTTNVIQFNKSIHNERSGARRLFSFWNEWLMNERKEESEESNTSGAPRPDRPRQANNSTNQMLRCCWRAFDGCVGGVNFSSLLSLGLLKQPKARRVMSSATQTNQRQLHSSSFKRQINFSLKTIGLQAFVFSLIRQQNGQERWSGREACCSGMEFARGRGASGS